MQGSDSSAFDSGQVQRRMRFDSYSQRTKEKKEIYISEAAMSQFTNQRNNTNNSSTNSYSNHKNQRNTDRNASANQTSTKVTSTDQFSAAVSNHNASLNASPQNPKLSTMKRLNLMKTDSQDGVQKNTESSEKKSLFIQIDRKFELKNSSILEQKDPKWAECKIIGSNIQSRSRSSICTYNDNLYVYGGYELTAGPLGDFWKINLKSGQYIWEKVKVRGKVNPGLKSRHTCEVYNNKMYIFGGQHGASISSSDMWCFDFQKEQWTMVVPLGKNEYNPPSIDSHSSILIGSKMYSMFGYFGDYGQLTNSVYEFNFETMCWTNKFKHQPIGAQDEKKQNSVPKCRLESSITYFKNQPNMIYAFGGIDGFHRLNDLWVFNLQSNSFSQIQVKSDVVPKIRNGHQIFSTENEIVVLGGIHDITWELDDLCMFDLRTQCWTIVDQDSARRRETSLLSSFSPENKKKDSGEPKNFARRSKRRGQSTMIDLTKRQSSTSSPSKKSYMRTSTFTHFDSMLDDESKQSVSPGLGSPTKLHEKKRKEFLQQKAQMLQVFDVDEIVGKNYKDLSPTSEAMKNSLFVIGNPMPHVKIRHGKLTGFGRVTVSRFLEPLNESNNIREGKKPCARDGHRILKIGNEKILLFGGDRHNMSFNDIYQLDLIKLQDKYNQLLSK